MYKCGSQLHIDVIKLFKNYNKDIKKWKEYNFTIVLDKDNYAVISEKSKIDKLYYIMSIFEDISDDIQESKYDGFGECQIDNTVIDKIEYVFYNKYSWIYRYYIDDYYSVVEQKISEYNKLKEQIEQEVCVN